MLNEQLTPTALGFFAQLLADHLAEGEADRSADFRAVLAEPAHGALGVKEAAFKFGCSRRHFNRIAPIVGARYGGQWRIEKSRFQSLLSAIGEGKTHISAAEIELWRLRQRLIPARDIQPALERISEIFERHFEALKNQSGRVYAASVAGGEEGCRRELSAIVHETRSAIRTELQALAHAENHGRKTNVG